MTPRRGGSNPPAPSPSPTPLGGTVAHISHRLGPFTGQVGPVVFVNGEAETDDDDMLLYFLDDPDTYDVTDARQDEDPRGEPDHDDPED